jgi:iron-sulfur cluster repair protein YtfE (RIC family)
MQPSEVRERVLQEHVALRGLLSRVESLAQLVAADEPARVDDLRAAAESLLDTLASHIEWEDRHLAPALRDANVRGTELEARLVRDHIEQREVLRHALERLHDKGRPAALMARNLLDLVTLLRVDMEDEESSLLGSDVLRDEPIRSAST